MTTLSTDTFVRSNQSGWGTASDGETWTTVAGTPTLAIASNEGTITTGAFAADAVVLLGSKTTTAINYLVRFKIADGNAGAVWRYQSAGNYYRLVCETGIAYLQKCVGGSISTITSAGGTFTSFCWLRVVSNTTDIAITLWADGSSEPGTPTISTTDSTFTTAGQYGVSDVSYAGGVSNYFDSLTVTDNASTTTSTRTISATAALLATNTRTIPATTPLLTTKIRTISDTAALLATSSRTIGATTTLIQARTRTIPTTAALGGSSRSIPATAALLATATRTIPTTAALSGVSTIIYNVAAQVRSGQASCFVRSGQAICSIRE